MEPSSFANVWHPSHNKSAQEWWYFALLCKDKTIIAGALTVSGAYQQNLTGEIWLSIYRQGKRPIEVFRKNIKNVQASTERVFVSINKNSFFEKNGRFFIHIDEPGIKLEASGRSLVRWDDNLVMQKVKNAGKIKWLIPVLRGEFKGELQIGNSKQPLSGTLFHDHVLVDLKPKLSFIRDFRGWLWGLVYKDNETILYVKADSRKDPFSFICYEKNGKVKKIPGVALLSKNLKTIVITGDLPATSTFDIIWRVPYYQGRSKLARFFYDKILKIRKYHAYNSNGKEYMECLVFKG